MFDAESRRKALEGRKAAKAASAHYKRNWLDSDLWDRLAQSRQIRLPQWGSRPTPRKLSRWHESLETEPFKDVYGASPRRLIELNKDTPLRAFVGQMLERAKRP